MKKFLLLLLILSLPGTAFASYRQNPYTQQKDFYETASEGGGVTSVTNSDGTITVSGTATAPIVSVNLGNANTWSATQTFSKDVAVQNASTNSTTGTINNLVTTGISNFTFTGANPVINGFANPADGKLLFVKYAGTPTLTLNNENGGSAAANRINTGTGASVTYSTNQTAILMYDTAFSRWRIIPTPFSVGSAFPGGVDTEVLYTHPSGTVTQSSNFKYDSSAGAITVGGYLAQSNFGLWNGILVVGGEIATTGGVGSVNPNSNTLEGAGGATTVDYLNGFLENAATPVVSWLGNTAPIMLNGDGSGDFSGGVTTLIPQFSGNNAQNWGDTLGNTYGRVDSNGNFIWLDDFSVTIFQVGLFQAPTFNTGGSLDASVWQVNGSLYGHVDATGNFIWTDGLGSPTFHVGNSGIGFPSTAPVTFGGPLQTAITANRAVVTDGSGTLVASVTSDTEISYVSGVTSAIQTQLNSKQASGTYLSEVGTADLATQSAAKTTTTLFTPGSSATYHISISIQVTRAASTSSILGGTTGVVITYTEPDGSVAQTITPLLVSQAGAVITVASGNVGNTTTTQSQGTAVIRAKSGVAVQYAIGYTSVGTTSMQYAAHLSATTQ